jgi:hypothetical protein
MSKTWSRIRIRIGMKIESWIRIDIKTLVAPYVLHQYSTRTVSFLFYPSPFRFLISSQSHRHKYLARVSTGTNYRYVTNIPVK